MDASGLESAKRTLFIALAADMVVTAAVAISDLWAIGILEGVRAGTSVVDQATISNLQFWEKFALLCFVTWIGVGVTLVKWLGAAYQYARDTLGATGFTQEKWKAWGWIVPYLNFFKPYQVLSEIYRAGSPGYVGDNWKKSSGSGLLLVWWMFWVISHMMMFGIGKSLMRDNPQGGSTLRQGIDGLHGSLTICVISMIVVGLWYVVAGSLSSRLLNRSVGFSGDASRAGVVDFVDTAPDGGNTAMAAKAAIDEETVYAQIAKEIEAGLIDQGLWTRLLAKADGDEKRTKVLYIKQRAERLLGPSATPAPAIKRKPTAAAKPSTTGLSAPAWATIVIGGVMVLGIVLAIALPAYQDYTKRANPFGKFDPSTAKPAPEPDRDKEQGAVPPPPVDWSQYSVIKPEAKPSQIDEFLKDAPRPTTKNGAYGVNDTLAPGQFDPSTAKLAPSLDDSREFLRAAGIGGRQDVGDVVAWGDAQLAARAVQGSNIVLAHNVAIQWQYQIAKALGDTPEHSLFLGYKIILQNLDQNHGICKPDPKLQSAIRSSPGEYFEPVFVCKKL